MLLLDLHDDCTVNGELMGGEIIQDLLNRGVNVQCPDFGYWPVFLVNYAPGVITLKTYAIRLIRITYILVQYTNLHIIQFYNRFTHVYKS